MCFICLSILQCLTNTRYIKGKNTVQHVATVYLKKKTFVDDR